MYVCMYGAHAQDCVACYTARAHSSQLACTLPVLQHLVIQLLFCYWPFLFIAARQHSVANYSQQQHCIAAAVGWACLEAEFCSQCSPRIFKLLYRIHNTTTLPQYALMLACLERRNSIAVRALLCCSILLGLVAQQGALALKVEARKHLLAARSAFLFSAFLPLEALNQRSVPSKGNIEKSISVCNCLDRSACFGQC